MSTNCETKIEHFPLYTGKLGNKAIPYGLVINELAFGYMIVDWESETIEFQSFPFVATELEEANNFSTMKIDFLSAPDKSVVIELDDFMKRSLEDIGRSNFAEHYTLLDYDYDSSTDQYASEMAVIDCGVLTNWTIPAVWLASTKVLHQFGIWRYILDHY